MVPTHRLIPGYFNFMPNPQTSSYKSNAHPLKKKTRLAPSLHLFSSIMELKSPFDCILFGIWFYSSISFVFFFNLNFCYLSNSCSWCCRSWWYFVLFQCWHCPSLQEKHRKFVLTSLPFFFTFFFYFLVLTLTFIPFFPRISSEKMWSFSWEKCITSSWTLSILRKLSFRAHCNHLYYFCFYKQN